MTILDTFINSVRIDPCSDKTAYMDNNYSIADKNAFSKVLESANKTFNFSYGQSAESSTDKTYLYNAEQSGNFDKSTNYEINDKGFLGTSTEYSSEGRVENRSSKESSDAYDWNSYQMQSQMQSYVSDPVRQNTVEQKPVENTNNTKADHVDASANRSSVAESHNRNELAHSENAARKEANAENNKKNETAKPENKNEAHHIGHNSVKVDSQAPKNAAAKADSDVKKVETAQTQNNQVKAEAALAEKSANKVGIGPEVKAINEQKSGDAAKNVNTLVAEMLSNSKNHKSEQTLTKDNQHVEAPKVDAKQQNNQTEDLKVKVDADKNTTETQQLAQNSKVKKAEDKTDKVTNQNIEANSAKKPENLEKDSIKVAISSDVKVKEEPVDNIKDKPKLSAEQNSTNVITPEMTKVQLNTRDKGQDPGNNQNFQDQQKMSERINIKISGNINQDISPDSNIFTKMNLESTSQLNKLAETSQPDQAQPSQILEQVKKATSELSAHKSEVSLVLNPENLGKVDINIASVKGELIAEIKAESQQVKDILGKEIDALKKNLQDQGINVNNITVKVQEPSQLDNKQFQANQEGHNFNNMNQDPNNFHSNSSNKNNNEYAPGTQKNTYKYDTEASEEVVETSRPAGNPANHAGMVDYRV